MRKRATYDEWVKRIARWEEGELTAEEFAAEIGVSAQSLRVWKLRLQAEAAGVVVEHGTKRTVNAEASMEKTPLNFVEMTSAVASAAIEIVLPSRVQLRVPTNFDPTTLRRLLDVLERR